MLWNFANSITFIRIILIPIFLFFLFQDTTLSRLIALGTFIIASLSDLFDGYIARKYHQVTQFGNFLDPLADKALVISTLVAFIYLDPLIPLWMVLVIIGRDLLISLMRYLGHKKNTTLKVSTLAKVKTAFQMFSIMIILLIFAVRSYRVDIQNTYARVHSEQSSHLQIAIRELISGLKKLEYNDNTNKKQRQKIIFAKSVPYFLMLLVTYLTLISGVRYVWVNYRILLPPYYFLSKKNN